MFNLLYGFGKFMGGSPPVSPSSDAPVQDLRNGKQTYRGPDVLVRV